MSMLMRELFSLKDWSRSDFKSFEVNLLCEMSITLMYLSNWVHEIRFLIKKSLKLFFLIITYLRPSVCYCQHGLHFLVPLPDSIIVESFLPVPIYESAGQLFYSIIKLRMFPGILPLLLFFSFSTVGCFFNFLCLSPSLHYPRSRLSA